MPELDDEVIHRLTDMSFILYAVKKVTTGKVTGSYVNELYIMNVQYTLHALNN